MNARTKEAHIYAPIPTQETCERTAHGLTVTSVVLQGKQDQCIGKNCEAQFIEARGSNINITAAINSPNPDAKNLPTLFSRELNKTREEASRFSHQEKADSAFRSTLSQLSLGEKDGIALAYERPVNRTSQLFLALGPKTLALVTGKGRHGRLITTYYQLKEEEMDSDGFYVPTNIRIPQGATVILATGLEQFPPHMGDFIAQAYANADVIMEILQSDFATTNTQNMTPEAISAAQREVIQAYLRLGFEPVINEHLVTAIDALRFNEGFQQIIQEGNSQAIIAKIIAKDLTTLQKDTIGNPTLEHNVAVITSRIS